MVKERGEDGNIDVVIMGRKIGTAHSWEEVDIENGVFLFNYFEPVDEVDLPADEAITIDTQHGLFLLHNEEGAIVYQVDLLPVIAELDRESMPSPDIAEVPDRAPLESDTDGEEEEEEEEDDKGIEASDAKD